MGVSHGVRRTTWNRSLKNWELQIPCFEEFSWGGNTLGLVPANLPHTLGYACTFYTPTSPSPTIWRKGKKTARKAKKQGQDDQGLGQVTSKAASHSKTWPMTGPSTPCAYNQAVTLPALQNFFLWFVFSYLPGNFELENGGDFRWVFSGLRFLRNEARKLVKNSGKIRGKIRGKTRDKHSGQNSGNFRSATFLT